MVISLARSREDTLATALTASKPNLLKVALTKATPELLATALEVILQREMLFADPNDLPQEAEPAILAVALTESRPDLLAVALQDATRENLKVFITSYLSLTLLCPFIGGSYICLNFPYPQPRLAEILCLVWTDKREYIRTVEIYQHSH